MSSGDYSINKITKELYIAEKRTNKNILRYEFYQTENGWVITSQHFNVDNPFPRTDEMYIPQEVIDKIILADSAKKKLSGK